VRRIAIVFVVGVMTLSVGLLLIAGRGIGAVHHRAWPFEEPIAKAAWRLLVPSSTRRAVNPVPATATVLKAAREHWADHCATCHDNDGSAETTIGRRVYPPVPDLRDRRTQNLTDGELFYAIERGIPWTAMPGWTTGTAEGEAESWALVRFIRHLPSITADELKEMERLNPKPPPNEGLEKEIDDFLKGPPASGAGRGGLP
jgi:mono/diheme cytochrome c family protein